jgi:hypothetical protein
LAITFSLGNAPEHCFPAGHRARSYRRFPEVIDDDTQRGEAVRHRSDIVEVAGEDHRDLQDDVPRLEQPEALRDMAAGQPVIVRLVVDEVPDGPELGPGCEVVQPLARAARPV